MKKPFPKRAKTILPNEPLEIEVTNAGFEAVLFGQITQIDLTDLEASFATLDAYLDR